jgi:hypothetical protein
LLYITVSVEQYCDITLVDALPENEGILEASRKDLSAGGNKTLWKPKSNLTCALAIYKVEISVNRP